MSTKFKNGDRVKFTFGHTADFGTIDSYDHFRDVYWVNWDSDGSNAFTHESYLTYAEVKTDNIVETQNEMTVKSHDHLKQAAISAINENNIVKAIEILKLVV